MPSNVLGSEAEAQDRCRAAGDEVACAVADIAVGQMTPAGMNCLWWANLQECTWVIVPPVVPPPGVIPVVPPGVIAGVPPGVIAGVHGVVPPPDVPEAVSEVDLIKPPEGICPIKTIRRIAELLFGILAIVAVIFIIIGAFQLMTAQGDATKIETGRTQITYAIIAVIVAAVSWGAVGWILGMIGDI